MCYRNCDMIQSDPLADFLSPNNYTPCFQAEHFPSFLCLHLSNICRLLSCHPLSHHLAELYRFSTFYLFLSRQASPPLSHLPLLSKCTSVFCPCIWPHDCLEPSRGSRVGIVFLLCCAGNQIRLWCSGLGSHWHCWSVHFSHSVVSTSLLPMDCSTPGFPVHHQLPEVAQTHVHRVGDAIQPSHPLSSPSPPAFSLSQHQQCWSVLPICPVHLNFFSQVCQFKDQGGKWV